MDKSTLHFMDSYLLKIKDEYFFATTQLELPFRLENQPLEVTFYRVNFISSSLEKINLINSPRGIHFRRIYDLKFKKSHFLYFIDHGLDIHPFPGGSVQKLDLDTKEIKLFKSFDKKFNFGGTACFWRNRLYEIFVGINYLPALYIDNVSSEEFDSVLNRVHKDMGFLTVSTFEKNENLYFFLGLTDLEKQFDKGLLRRDSLISFDGSGWMTKLLSRGVPNSWATVFSEVTTYQGRRVLIVSHHDNGFNNFEIGFYEIDEDFRYVTITSSEQLGLNSVWVPGFLSYNFLGKNYWYVWIRPGSAWDGEKCSYLIIDELGNVQRMSQQFTGIFQIESSLFGVTYNMELVNITG